MELKVLTYSVTELPDSRIRAVSAQIISSVGFSRGVESPDGLNGVPALFLQAASVAVGLQAAILVELRVELSNWL